MYLAISDHAISLMLIRQHEGTQRPTYYLNKTLVDAETWYLPLKKIALALVYAIRKLPHYFQAHTIWVLIKYHFVAIVKKVGLHGKDSKMGDEIGDI